MTYTDSAWGYVPTTVTDPTWVDSAWGYTSASLGTGPTYVDSDWAYVSVTLNDPSGNWGYIATAIIPGIVWEWNGTVWKAITLHVR